MCSLNFQPKALKYEQSMNVNLQMRTLLSGVCQEYFRSTSILEVKAKGIMKSSIMCGYVKTILLEMIRYEQHLTPFTKRYIIKATNMTPRGNASPLTI